MAQARKRKGNEEASPNGPPELTISSKEIAAALRKYVEGFEPSMEREEIGRVLTGDILLLATEESLAQWHMVWPAEQAGRVAVAA